MTSDAPRPLPGQGRPIPLALASGDPAAVGQSLAALRHRVGSLESRGQLSADRANGILAAVDAVQSDLVLLSTTTSSTTTTTSPHPGHHHQDQGGGGNG